MAQTAGVDAQAGDDILAAARRRRHLARQPAVPHRAGRRRGRATRAYRRLRRQVFVDEQGLFDGHDLDDRDDDPRTVVLVARDRDGDGASAGCGSAPPTAARTSAGGPAGGWWSHRRPGAAARASARPLVRAACARAEAAGALRFDATVQARNEVFFRAAGLAARSGRSPWRARRTC